MTWNRSSRSRGTDWLGPNSACAQYKPCYNRARLETPPLSVKRKSTSPASTKIHRGTHVERRPCLSQNRRRGPSGGNFSLGNSRMGSPRPDPSSPHREPVSSLHQRPRAPAEKTPLPPQTPRTEPPRHL